jgi:hypothetical protein
VRDDAETELSCKINQPKRADLPQLTRTVLGETGQRPHGTRDEIILRVEVQEPEKLRDVLLCEEVAAKACICSLVSIAYAPTPPQSEPEAKFATACNA